ncbi:SDR family oxidoreductase [Catenulispora rubra]|uniref:SDR family oxidoreductase n=1 Tax=Catenulispora rubra TaxID=280293 RepID=UPI00189257EF|nr:SDR family oxidoreductase [Catenulispora rubra]
MDLGLDGRVALVCSSTSGLGEAIARALAAEGAEVVVTGRRGERARAIAGELPKATGVQADLFDPQGPENLLRACQEAFGPPDILVLNGPGPGPGRITAVEHAELDRAFTALVTVHHRLLTLALPAMRERRWGRVLAVGSSAVVAPIPDLALSGVGRSALASYLKSLAAEVAADGVTVNMLLPGRVDTDRVRAVDAARAAKSGRTPEQVKQESLAGIPAGRYGDPAEFGAVAAFLCSRQAAYLTGAAVPCDGGQSPVL